MEFETVANKVYRKAENIVSRLVLGETLLIPVMGDLARMDAVFSMTPVGAFIWERLDGHRNLGCIRDAMLDEFDVAGNDAGKDLQIFVDNLIKEKLVEEVIP